MYSSSSHVLVYTILFCGFFEVYENECQSLVEIPFQQIFADELRFKNSILTKHFMSVEFLLLCFII